MLLQLGRRLLTSVLNSTGACVAPRRCYAIKRGVIDHFETEEEYLKSLEAKKQRKRRAPDKKTEKKKEKLVEDTAVSDEEYNIYSDIPKEILNLKFTKPNPASIGTFSRMMLNMKSRSYRERHGTCLLEGRFLITDAMNSGMFIRNVYFSRLQNLVGLPVDILSKTNLVKMGFEEIKLASEVKVQTDGLLAIATKQDDVTRKKVIKARRELMHENGETILPVTLVCDNVRDAGNMGTILRSAAAAGCEQVLVTEGCTDVWDSKAVRAGAGAHFKIPIIPNLSWEDVSDHMKPYDVRDVLLSHHSMEDVKLCDILPRSNNEGPSLHEKLTSDMNLKSDEKTKSEEYDKVVFKSRPYYDITFMNKGHTVVIIGGEVHGVSADACIYALETLAGREIKGQRLGHGSLVNIPMSVGTDCLNTAVSGSVILFEARRQMLQAEK